MNNIGRNKTLWLKKQGCIFFDEEHEAWQKDGEYSTREKALKVLDEIQIYITKKENDIYNSKFGVFQMPLDSEVSE